MSYITCLLHTEAYISYIWYVGEFYHVLYIHHDFRVGELIVTSYNSLTLNATFIFN